MNTNGMSDFELQAYFALLIVIGIIIVVRTVYKLFTRELNSDDWLILFIAITFIATALTGFYYLNLPMEAWAL